MSSYLANSHIHPSPRPRWIRRPCVFRMLIDTKSTTTTMEPMGASRSKLRWYWATNHVGSSQRSGPTCPRHVLSKSGTASRWKSGCTASRVGSARLGGTICVLRCGLRVAPRRFRILMGRCVRSCVIRSISCTSTFNPTQSPGIWDWTFGTGRSGKQIAHWCELFFFLLSRHRLPTTLELPLAALAEPLSVVLHAFRRAHLTPGARILVLGAGAVGLLVCALARASGCTTVVAVDIEQGKLDFAKEMDWATGIFTLPKGPRVSGIEALEVAKTGWEGLKASQAVQGVEGLDEGFDAVFECTGVESCMQLSVMVSFVSGIIRFGYNPPTLVAETRLAGGQKGCSARYQSLDGRHGNRQPLPAHGRLDHSRSRHHRRVPIRQYLPRRPLSPRFW